MNRQAIVIRASGANLIAETPRFCHLWYTHICQCTSCIYSVPRGGH